VNYHTNEIVGIAEDAFSLNVIRDELQELQKASKTDEQLLQETDDCSNSLPQQARHFLVFIATTWSEKLPQEFLVARYGKKSIESDFLMDAIRSIIVDLGLYGFIVDTITGDSTSENRKVFKMLATFSARQVFFELNGERIWPEEYLDGLPLDFKIAFRHPTPSYGNLNSLAAKCLILQRSLETTCPISRGSLYFVANQSICKSVMWHGRMLETAMLHL
jgi:hypothetical protein